MIERKKRRLNMYTSDMADTRQVMVVMPESYSHILFRIWEKRYNKEDVYAVVRFHEEEILAIEQFIADWKQERLRVRARNAQAAARRKATDPAPPS